MILSSMILSTPSAVIDTPLQRARELRLLSAMVFGSRAEFLEQFRKPENFWHTDLGNSRDF